MELHLLLGVLSHLFKTSKKVWPDIKQWVRALHMKQEPNNGGQLIGNDSHKLLNNVDLLQLMAEQASIFQIFGYIDTIQKFKSVVSACFGMTLNDDC